MYLPTTAHRRHNKKPGRCRALQSIIDCNNQAALEIQLDRADFGAAPTLMSATSPALNSASVGIERTPNLAASSGFSSMLSLTTLTLPAISTEISSRLGAIILHGPHHSAQKS